MFLKMFRSSCVVSFSKETDSSSFFFLPPFPIFSLEFGGKKYSNPDESLPGSQNWKIDVSRGKREKKKKGKKQIEGKRFHRRISRIGRVRNVFVQYKPAESGLLFTLHGIHSSPAKRVKTQKSESLFVTSFDVAINSFEITAGYTGPNIRQPAPIFSRKFKFPANRRLGSRSQFKRLSSSFFSSWYLRLRPRLRPRVFYFFLH